jgi:uncharacterized protein (TIGR02453 family)
MLQKSTLQFLKDLAANNNRIWFDANRHAYEAAKADFEAFIARLLRELAQQDASLEGVQAKDCIFRIFRDVRFSKNKEPYKPNFGAAISAAGRKPSGAGYYLHLEPGHSFWGGGMWLPPAAVLKAVRQEIDYNLAEFTGILQQKEFRKLFQSIAGEKLKTAPKGYAADNPAMEYLKLKSFTVGHPLADSLLTKNDLIPESVQAFTVMKPFIAFLNRALD